MSLCRCVLQICTCVLVFGVLGANSLDTNNAEDLLQFLETYKSELSSQYNKDNSPQSYDVPTYDNVALSSLLKRGAPVYDDASYKRFGFMGSRGKRQGASKVIRAMADLLDLYNQRLSHAIERAQYFTEEFPDYKYKRQPHLGFHGARG